jgi:curli biogenesis system outer membrane secretion channel CsgG
MKGATLVGAERVTTGTVVVYEVQARKGGRSRFLTYDPNGVRKE